MFHATRLVALTALASLVGAQNYTTSGPLNVTASQIPLVQRQVWCNSQETLCPEICGGVPKSNLCNPDDLSYSCQCAGGHTPNISDYKETLPFYICQEWVANCVDNHPNNLKGITACRSVTCGTKNASDLGANGAPAASSSGGSSGSKPTNSASSSSSKNLAAATHVAATYGTHIIAGGMLAAFGLAL